MPTIDELRRAITEAAQEQAKRDNAVARTQRLVIDYASELSDFIAALPQELVARVGLGVRVATRGHVANPPTNIEIEEQPALDDPEYDARPGATALYLEAFGEGTDRVFYEIRSNPGILVMAGAYANDPNMERYHIVEIHKQRLEPVRGITTAEDGLMLVFEPEQDEFQLGLRPDAFLNTFLGLVRDVAARRARFNRGDRMTRDSP